MFQNIATCAAASGVSEAAAGAAIGAFLTEVNEEDLPEKQVAVVLAAVHDPKLGRGRSVRLAEVIDALDGSPSQWGRLASAAYLEERFTT